MKRPSDTSAKTLESDSVQSGTPDSANAPTPAGTLRPWDLALCFWLAVLVDLVVGGQMLPGVLAGGLVNPDSYMRLVRLDEILSAGQVLDEVARDGSGRGTQLHWAHLVDSLLLLLAQPLHLFLPWRESLHAAAAAFGPLGVGALGAAAAWAAAPLAARSFLWLAPLAAGLAPAVAGYGIPGVLHHHGALMVVVTMLGGWALRGAMADPPRGAGIAMGAWSAVGIWFTPEAMPFILLAFGLVWIAWLEGPPGNASRRVVREAGFGFLLAVALILSADPPRPDRWAALPDRISSLHLAMAASTALAAAFTWWVDRLPLPRWPRLAVGCAVGAVCVGAWIALFPGLLRGAEGLLDEATGALFFRGIAEMAPVRGLADWLTYLSGGIAGAVVIGVLAVRSGNLAALAGAVAAVALVAFSVQHVRFASYPACLAAALLPVVLTRLSAALAGSRAALARVGTIVVFILLPQLGSTLARPSAPPAGAPGAACPVEAAVPLLLPHPGRVVLSDVNDVPEILYRTQVKTVGSLYHRSAGNFLRLREAWRGNGIAPLRAAEVELVLFCPRPRAGSIVHDLPEGTLYDALLAGQPPSWLVEIGRGVAGHVLYEVRR
jgi:hypothetical protein